MNLTNQSSISTDFPPQAIMGPNSALSKYLMLFQNFSFWNSYLEFRGTHKFLPFFLPLSLRCDTATDDFSQYGLTGSPADPANKGYRIWHSVIASGETPPANPGDLRKSFFTKRKKDVIEFDFGDSGKTAYFAVQIENEGKKGPWGPLVSALIP
jgi:hypothetical protein